MRPDDHPTPEPGLNGEGQASFIGMRNPKALRRSSVADADFAPPIAYTDHSAPVQKRRTRQAIMFRKTASLIVAVATLALAPVLATEAVAQARDPRQPPPSDDRRPPPRVSPAEARRSAAPYGRPIDTQPRRDGNYSVLVERDGRVRDVVVDGQTGRPRQGDSGGDDQRRRPN